MSLQRKKGVWRNATPRKKLMCAALPLLLLTLVVGWVIAALGITDITPDEGPSTGGTDIIITGTDFDKYTLPTPNNYSSAGCSTYVVSADGYYKLETWGAQGGSASSYVGGRGGYATGTVWLTKDTRAWVCVGGQGTSANKTGTVAWSGGFNGGGGAWRSDNGNGRETASGGGGTDIRINVDSPYARVIAAGGGGGAAGVQWMATGGAGGGLSGTASASGNGMGTAGGVGTQTSGGANSGTGCTGSASFGTANSSCDYASTNISGGGGGWFGGGTGWGGSGGSGFVYTSTSDVRTTILGGTYLLGSQYQMFNTSMVAGNTLGAMPAPGGGVQTGQPGNGYARITQLPYYVLVGGQPCLSVEMLNDTQIKCKVQAHSAAKVDVLVYVGGSTYTKTNGYTYTDKLDLTGPTTLSSTGSGNYTVTLDYNYTGTVMLDDGGVGGTFVGGNQLNYSNQRTRTFTYIPPTGYQGEVVITADSGVTYVVNDSLIVTVTTMATSFIFQCRADGTSGDWTTNTFIKPGMPMDCQIILDGTYNGTISLADATGETPTSVLGGAFTSSDARLSGGVFTTTTANTAEIADQVLSFTYTSPDWDFIMDNLYDYEEENGYYLFWPILTAVSSQSLTPAQRSVSVGLLAQGYEIFSMDHPPIDEHFGCIGCVARFGLSTFNAPYFGSITLSSDMDGFFDISGLGDFNTTATFDFDGSGSSESFRYRPNAGSEGIHTISGESSDPAVEDGSISFDVNSSHTILTCEPAYIARGGSSNCILEVNPLDSDPHSIVRIRDLFISYIAPQTNGHGTFTDTSAMAGTFDGVMGVYAFCDLGDDAGCTTETWERSFTYTLPEDTDSEFAVVRIQAEYEADGGTDINWALLNIVPDTMLFECSYMTPDCGVNRVSMTRDYTLRPNGVFAGQVRITAIGDPDADFSDGGIANWNYDALEFDFTYRPASSGVKTLVAEVIRVDDPNSGIKIGDKYYLEVIVMGDNITITGPDFVARDEVPTMPRFAATVDGPFIGTLVGRMVRYDGITEISFTSSNLVTLFNLDDLGNGTFSCTVTQAQYESGILPNGQPFYDPVTNTTTACLADSASAAGFIDNYNWFEIHVAAQDDPTILEAIHHVGLIADDYMITESGINVDNNVSNPIIAGVGVPLDFMLTPNALYAGTYTFDDGESAGYFVPPGTYTQTADSWPAFNDQTLQSQTFTYVPLETGYHTITVNASRSGPGVPASPLNLPTKTITLLVVANNAAITGGPSTVVRGATYEYSLVLNGPWEGRIYLSDSLDEDLDGDSIVDYEEHIQRPGFNNPGDIYRYCDFTYDDYDAKTNTTSCSFEFTVTDESLYTNSANLFASDVGFSSPVSKFIDVIANNFDLASDTTPASDENIVIADDWRMHLDNRRLNTPINFTLTPNAQFEGVFKIAMVSDIETSHGQPCPTAEQFYATIDPSQITYQYVEYLGFDSITSLPKTFVITPQSYGHICILITPEDYGDLAYIDAGVIIEPKIIEIYTHGDPHIGGPTNIVAASQDNGYQLIVDGDPEFTVYFHVVDPTTCNPSDPYDCDAPISDIVLGGDRITQDSSGFAECTFYGGNLTSPAVCDFTLSLPDRFVGNYIRILGEDDEGSRDYHDVIILANKFEVTPAETKGAVLDQPITFTVRPLNGLYAGTFSLVNGSSGGVFSPASVTFASSNWPDDNTPQAGQTFTYAPHKYGWNTITITDASANDLGFEVARILVVADTMDLSGTNAIQIANTMTGSYTLNIHGPYEGTISFAVTDAATGLSVGGATLDNSGSCDVGYDDYDETTNSSVCEFTLTLPANYSGSKYIRISAVDSTTITPTNMVVAITANDYMVTPTTESIVSVGTPVTFTITPNSVYSGSFGNRNNRTSTGGPANVAFATSDWAVTSDSDVSKTFTVTPTEPGRHTITVSSPLGDKVVTILVLADCIDVTGPGRIQKGTTSEDFTIVINGPYEGTATVDVYIPDGADGLPATGVTLSKDTHNLTLDDYDPVTNTTTSTFKVDIPASHSTNYIGIVATAPGLEADPIVAITANEFTLTPDVANGVVGSATTFTVTPNGLFEGTINLSDGGAGGTFSPTSVVFNSSDWPDSVDQTLPDGLRFTYTPATIGDITITASDADIGATGLGEQEAIITVVAAKDPRKDPIIPPVADTSVSPGSGFFGGVAGDFVRAGSMIGGLVSAVVIVWLATRKLRKKV